MKMKSIDFAHEYNLHDSFIKSVEKDDDNHTMTLNINFAFWMQKDYVEGTPENGIIKVTFKNVHSYQCEEGDPAGAFVGILNAEYKNGSLLIGLLDDESVTYFDMVITADEVTVTLEENCKD